VNSALEGFVERADAAMWDKEVSKSGRQERERGELMSKT
jgi:hypothetical protein